MKLVKIIIITGILTCSYYVHAQFFVGFNSGYSFSLSKSGEGVFMIDPLPVDHNTSSMAIHPMFYYNSTREMICIKPQLGSGINSELSVGYKTGFLGVKLSVGTNNSAINFKNKNNTITRMESETYYDLDSPNMPYYWDDGFDEYLTIENSYYLDFKYNIVQINPAMFAEFEIGKFSIGASTGISFNFIDLAIYGKTLMNGYNDSYSKTYVYEATFLYNFDRDILEDRYENVEPQKAIISYTLGFNLGYKINEQVLINCNLSYRPLYYSPRYLLITDKKSIVNENGQISEFPKEDNLTTLVYEPFYYSDDFWFQMREYNFTSIEVGVGVKYVFNNFH